MNISKYKWGYFVGLAIIIGCYLYININSRVEIIESKESGALLAAADTHMIPEWETYSHTYGYTIEYPQNILPSMRFGDAPNVTFFYKTSYEEIPYIVVRTSASRGMSVPEWNRTIPTATLKKVSISNINIDAYVVSDSLQSPDITDVQLVKDGVLYRINIAGLPQTLTEHIINSFQINFVPENLKLF